MTEVGNLPWVNIRKAMLERHLAGQVEYQMKLRLLKILKKQRFSSPYN